MSSRSWTSLFSWRRLTLFAGLNHYHHRCFWIRIFLNRKITLPQNLKWTLCCPPAETVRGQREPSKHLKPQTNSKSTRELTGPKLLLRRVGHASGRRRRDQDHSVCYVIRETGQTDSAGWRVAVAAYQYALLLVGSYCGDDELVRHWEGRRFPRERGLVFLRAYFHVGWCREICVCVWKRVEVSVWKARFFGRWTPAPGDGGLF